MMINLHLCITLDIYKCTTTSFFYHIVKMTNQGKIRNTITKIIEPGFDVSAFKFEFYFF